MSWINAVTNPEGLVAIFEGESPPLVSTTVHEVVVSREGPSVRVRLDLPKYPRNPPAKWQRNGFNTVQIELLFGGVDDLAVRGLSTEIVADLDVHREDKVMLTLNSSTMSLSLSAASVAISKISAYLNE